MVQIQEQPDEPRNKGAHHRTTIADAVVVSLARAVRKRVENETRNGFAAMGHAPVGHVYTPHRPDSRNEVLLETHTSNIIGFMWGDCASPESLMDRQALRRGDFSAVIFAVIN